METDEVLETGYGLATPPGDNLCNDYAAGIAEGFLALGQARGDRVVADDPDVAMVDGGSASLFGNVALLRRPIDAAAWPALTARIHAHFEGHPGGGFLLFSAWPTPDLRHDGLTRFGHPPLMLRPPAPLVDEPVDGLELRRVLDADTARDWESTLVRGYPLAELDPDDAGLLPAGAPRRTAVAALGRISRRGAGRHGIGNRRRPPCRCGVRRDIARGPRSGYRQGDDGGRHAGRARSSRDADLQRRRSPRVRATRLHPAAATHALGRAPALTDGAGDALLRGDN